MWARQFILAAVLMIALVIGTPHAPGQGSAAASTQEDVLASRLMKMFIQFPEVVGSISLESAQAPRAERWKAAFAALGKYYETPAVTVESYLTLLADRFVKSGATQPLVRARAHLIRQEFTEAKAYGLRLAEDKMAGAADQGMARAIAIISAAEEDRMADAEIHLRKLVTLVEKTRTDSAGWIENAERAIHLSARIGRENFECRMTQALMEVCEEDLGETHERTIKWKLRRAAQLQQVKMADEALEILMPLWIDLRLIHGETAVATVRVALSMVEPLRAAGKHDEAAEMLKKLAPVSEEAREMLASRPPPPRARPVPPPDAETKTVTTPEQRARRRQELMLLAGQAQDSFQRQYFNTAEMKQRGLVAAALRDLGPEDELTLQERSNLVVMLNVNNQPAEAETLARELIALMEKQAQPDMDVLLRCRDGLGNSLARQGFPYSAMIERERVLELREKYFGRYQPQTLATRHGQLTTLLLLERMGEALLLMQELMLQSAVVQGPGHMTTLHYRRLLAIMFGEMGLNNLAMRIQQDLMDQVQSSYGPRHSLAILTRTDQALVLLGRGEFDQALHQAEMASEAAAAAAKEAHGNPGPEDHQSHDVAKEVFAEVRKSRDVWAEAVKSETEHPLDTVVITACPKEHQVRKSPRGEAVEELWLARDYTQAMTKADAILAEVQTIRELEGPAHFHIRLLHADCQRRLDHLHEAEEELYDLLRHATAALGKEDVFTMAVRFTLARTLCALEDPSSAQPHFQQVVARYAEALGGAHPATLMARYFHGVALAEMERFAEARQEWWRAALGLVYTHQPDSHPVMAASKRLIATRHTVRQETRPSSVFVPYRMILLDDEPRPQVRVYQRGAARLGEADKAALRGLLPNRDQTSPFFSPPSQGIPRVPVSAPALPSPAYWPAIPPAFDRR